MSVLNPIAQGANEHTGRRGCVRCGCRERAGVKVARSKPAPQYAMLAKQSHTHQCSHRHVYNKIRAAKGGAERRRRPRNATLTTGSPPYGNAPSYCSQLHDNVMNKPEGRLLQVLVHLHGNNVLAPCMYVAVFSAPGARSLPQERGDGCGNGLAQQKKQQPLRGGRGFPLRRAPEAPPGPIPGSCPLPTAYITG